MFLKSSDSAITSDTCIHFINNMLLWTKLSFTIITNWVAIYNDYDQTVILSTPCILRLQGEGKRKLEQPPPQPQNTRTADAVSGQSCNDIGTGVHVGEISLKI